MRHQIIAASLLTVSLALAGCANSEGGTSAATSPTPAADPGEKFVSSVIDAHLDSYTDGIPAANELKTFPPKWCAALKAGHSVEWVLGDGNLYPIGDTWGTEKTDAYQLVVLGTQAYCPKYEAAVKKELRDTGVY